MKKFFLIIILLISSLAYSQVQTDVVKGRVQSETSESILQNVHVLNLTKVKGTITNSSGEFEIQAKVNDTLYFSYIGYKPLKIVVTNDLVRFEDNTIELTELAFALEEVIIKPYQLTGYLEIDARNIPLSKTYRYNIPGLPSRGYEGGSNSPGAITKVFAAIFNPVDFLYNIFGKKPKQMKKLKLMKEDYQIRELLSTKFDRETLVELLQIDKFDIDEILRNCSYSESFILSANDLQILQAISQCYEEFKLLNRK